MWCMFLYTRSTNNRNNTYIIRKLIIYSFCQSIKQKMCFEVKVTDYGRASHIYDAHWMYLPLHRALFIVSYFNCDFNEWIWEWYRASNPTLCFISTIPLNMLSGSSTDPWQALVLLPVGVLQPLHELGVAQQVPVEGAVLGQAQVGCVLRQGGALVMALDDRVGETIRNTFNKRVGRVKPNIKSHSIFMRTHKCTQNMRNIYLPITNICG